jgi:uncharacterized SAM-binding protein YcdF (DUF218 family)
MPHRTRDGTAKIRWLLAILVVAVVGVVAVSPVRRALLRRVGQLLTSGDDAAPAEMLAMDVESSAAGMLTLSDLYRAQPTATVGLLRPAPTSVDGEFARRGVVLPDLALDALVQLGVPKDAIVPIPAGEGGTTETTAALAGWARAHPGKRVLVVVGPSHSRRYQRALRRAWPPAHPAPVVVTTQYGLFRSEDWWQSRTTLREGLVELEKLALDYAAHPW